MENEIKKFNGSQNDFENEEKNSPLNLESSFMPLKDTPS